LQMHDRPHRRSQQDGQRGSPGVREPAIDKAAKENLLLQRSEKNETENEYGKMRIARAVENVPS
jgi:hypothetical protein